MAPGYALALSLEAIGWVGVVFALLAMRAERRTRIATLSDVLRAGGGSARRRNVPLRLVEASGPAERSDEAHVTFVDARSALRRALPTACAA